MSFSQGCPKTELSITACIKQHSLINWYMPNNDYTSKEIMLRIIDGAGSVCEYAWVTLSFVNLVTAQQGKHTCNYWMNIEVNVKWLLLLIILVPPTRGMESFSFLETPDGRQIALNTRASINVEWGPTTSIGASSELLSVPFILTQWKPRQNNKERASPLNGFLRILEISTDDLIKTMVGFCVAKLDNDVAKVFMYSHYPMALIYPSNFQPHPTGIYS